MKTALVCVLVVCGAIGSCIALQCYSCSGETCADPLNVTDATIETCDDGDVCLASNSNGFFSRSCFASGACSNGCTTTTAGDRLCGYCCNDTDLCNDRVIEDVVKDYLHCYVCGYSTDPQYAGVSVEACNDPFDPDGEGITTLPCDGACQTITSSTNGFMTLGRICLPASIPCKPQCNIGSCTKCCSDNLCNGDSAAFFTGRGTALTTGLATVLFISLSPHVTRYL